MITIFLDIDGVLVTREDLSHVDENGIHFFSQSCVNNLNRITDLTGASIVISSSWRITTPNISELLLSRGITGEIVGITPMMQTRGEEISSFLFNNPEITQFVILDDETFDMGHLLNWVVVTDFQSGLTAENVNQAILILGNQ